MATIAEKLTTIAENQQKVFEAGKAQGGNSWYDTFWDAYQQNGKRKHYVNAFTNQGWTDITYNPKHQFPPLEYASSMFSQASITDTKIPINFASVIQTSSVFSYCYGLVTIRTLIVSESVVFSTWFQNCTALENIEFEGTIANNLDIHWSTLLTAESYNSIITHCSKTATFTLTLPPEETVRSVYDAKFGAGAWDTIVAEYSNLTIAYS